MQPSSFAGSPAARILQRLLTRLSDEIEAEGLCLRNENGVLLEVGHPAAESLAEPFSGYTLDISFGAERMTPAVRRRLRVYRRITDIVLRGMREPALPQFSGKALGRIGVDFLLDALVEIFLILEEKSILLDHYQRILQLNEKILMAEDLFGTLQVVMDMAREAVGAEGASLLLVDQRTGEMYFNVVSGDRRSDLREVRLPPGQGIAGSVVQSARAEIIRDVKADSRAFRDVDQQIGHTTRDMMIAPIIARGQVIGVIEVINSTSTHGFLSEELDVLQNIASHASLFIENSKSKEDLLRSNRELDRRHTEIQTLHEIGRALNSSLDPVELQRTLLRTLLRLMHIDSGMILEIGEQRRTLSRSLAMHNEGEGIVESTAAGQTIFVEATDALLWMQEYREPFYFSQSEEQEVDPRLGLANRLKQANAESFESAGAPDAWIPVFAPDNETIKFVISLSGAQLRRRDPVSDLAFFRSVMNLAYAAFRNVASYAEALLARQQEQQIRQSFQKYVPLRVIQEVLQESDESPPRQQAVSVFFLDLHDFTSLAEHTEPEHLVHLLNEFYEEAAPAVDAHGGVIDKFMGDGFMALFGLPEAREDDSVRAVDCLRTIFERLARLNRRRADEGRPLFSAGAGVHAGMAIVGNLGSRMRMDYTAIGDAVNLAARVEKLARFYGGDVLLTEEVQQKSAAVWPAREADLVQVRGRNRATRIYQPWLQGADQAAEWDRTWQKALFQYRARNFQEAFAHFERVRRAGSEDPLADLYLRRCSDFQRNPPPPEWDGVFRVDV
ncbi:MAG: GAF domain-containing protein [Leptospirales bacterium]|nr:GAF domain-containing protein [Leptospirales bacterium]